MTVLALFLEKKQELEQVGIDVFSAEVKKQIAEQLEMDDFNTLNVYIKRLKDKNALIYNNQQYKFNPLLVKSENEEGIYFKWQEKKN